MSDAGRLTRSVPSVVSTVNGALRRVPHWLLYVIGAAYGGWLFFLAATGQLGADPIEALEHRYGELALQLLIAGLAVTPLRTYLNLNLLCFRRAIGVLCFLFVVAHMAVWAVLDVQTLSAMWGDVLDRPYVTIGMAAFLLLLPLGVTSNNLSIRKLGAVAWRKLHRLVYPAAVFGGLHYVWLAKGFQVEPLIYMAVILALVGLRFLPKRSRVAR